MTAPRITRHVAQLWQQGIRSAHRLDERTHGWLELLAGAAKEALRPDSGIMAAAIAYYALFSLFPLILLSIAIASFSLGPAVDQQLVVQKLEFIAPALGQLLGPNIDKIILARGPVSSVALVGLIWSASTVFYTLTLTLNGMWGIKRRRPVWKRRGLAMLFVLAFVGPTLFLASFAGSMISNLHSWLPDPIIPTGSGISLALAILLDVASFMVLYMLLPHGAATWREILPGADWGRLPLGAGQESLPVLCFHLHLRLEPSLWFSGSHYRLPGLGLSEQPHLSLWRLLERLLLPAQTAATRSGRPCKRRWSGGRICEARRRARRGVRSGVGDFPLTWNSTWRLAMGSRWT
jgi:YihY family inner membrane protein